MLFTGDPLPDVARRSLAVEPMTCPPNAFRTGGRRGPHRAGRVVPRGVGDRAAHRPRLSRRVGASQRRIITRNQPPRLDVFESNRMSGDDLCEIGLDGQVTDVAAAQDF